MRLPQREPNPKSINLHILIGSRLAVGQLDATPTILDGRLGIGEPGATQGIRIEDKGIKGDSAPYHRDSGGLNPSIHVNIQVGIVGCLGLEEGGHGEEGFLHQLIRPALIAHSDDPRGANLGAIRCGSIIIGERDLIALMDESGIIAQVEPGLSYARSSGINHHGTGRRIESLKLPHGPELQEEVVDEAHGILGLS